MNISMDSRLNATGLYNDTVISNDSSFSSSSGNTDFDTPLYLLLVITTLHVTAFLLGVCGNVIAVVVLLKNRFVFETTGSSLLNLAVADLLVILLAQPTVVMEFFTQEVWHLGEAMCKLVPFLENSAANASILTILFISVERYFAICHPFLFPSRLLKQKNRQIMIGLWIIAFGVASPLLVISNHKMSSFYDGRKVPVCRSTVNELWKQVYVISMLGVFYLMPAILFVFVYTAVIKRLTLDSSEMVLVGKDSEASRNILKNRKQVVRLLVLLIFLFFACVLPFRVVSIWFIYAPKSHVRNLGVAGYLWLTHLPRCLLYINSAVNPIVYNLVSKRFRQAFFSTLMCRTNRQCASSNVESRNSGGPERFKLLPQNSMSKINSVKSTSQNMTLLTT